VFTKTHYQTYTDPVECNPVTLAALPLSHVRAGHACPKHLPIDLHLTLKTLQRKLLNSCSEVNKQHNTMSKKKSKQKRKKLQINKIRQIISLDRTKKYKNSVYVLTRTYTCIAKKFKLVTQQGLQISFMNNVII
jgi:hypothetical protein